MKHFAIIGIGCGLVSALLFGVTGRVSFLSFVMFFLVPLPLFLAGLSMGAVTAAIGGVTGAVAAGAILGARAGLSFVISVAVAPVVLSYLALLSRSSDASQDGAAQQVEWYPLGRLVLWCAVLSPALMAVSIVLSGMDAAAFREAIRQFSELWLKAQPELRAQFEQAGGIEPLVDFLVRMVPSFATSVWMLLIMGNLWLAAKVLDVSGRSMRPWPPFPDIEFPRMALAGLAASLGATLLPGALGLIGQGFAGSMITVFAVFGLAVLHHITRGYPARAFLLATAYLAVFVFNWLAAVLLAGLGVAELGFGLRKRGSASGPAGT
ncbi:MAG: DUF2232 domain-containing protein [Hyphomicrobiales bacterium]